MKSLLFSFMSLILMMSTVYPELFAPPPDIIFEPKNPIIDHWKSSATTPSYWYQPLPKTFLLDDFEDGNYFERPTWWIFDKIELNMVENDRRSTANAFLGKKSIAINGKTKKWLSGGIGTYIALDGTNYDAIKLIIRGFGPDSGRIRFELYDDDNGNSILEKRKNSRYLAEDDMFIYLKDIDWSGWKVVIIPFADFVDANPKIGDDIWNPNKKNFSGGFLQMQMLFLGTKQKSKIRMEIDSIKFFSLKNAPLINPNDLLKEDSFF